MVVTDSSVPTPKALPMVLAGIEVLQLWLGEAASPRSCTAGKVPPAVQPPLEELNSADMIVPAGR